jgi:hypothetical protein
MALVSSDARERFGGFGRWRLKAALVFLPFPLQGNLSLFPLNGVYWSLFFEFIVNIFYATLKPLLTDFTLGSIIVISGILITILTYRHGSLDAGFLWTVAGLGIGLLRATFGIFTGLLLHRHSSFFSRFTKCNSSWIIFLIVGMSFALPKAEYANWLIDIVCVFVMFPLCVIMGSRVCTDRSASVLLALGSSSYPVYVLHVPLARIVYLSCHSLWHNNSVYRSFSGILFVIALVASSAAIEQRYDIPVRRRLLGMLLLPARD